MLVGQRAAVRGGLLERVVGCHLGVEQQRHDLLVDRADQLFEHDRALVAVLDERVLLRHAAEVDALAHVVHRLEVLAPADVDDLEHDEALEVAHQAFLDLLDLGLALGVRLERVVDELLGDRVAVEPAQLLLGHAGAVDRLHRDDERAEVPFLAHLVLQVRERDAGDHLGDPVLAHELGEVLAVEDAPPLLVDLLALHVHHVVVLEDVLPGDEVLLLDLLLRVLDLAREDARLHRLVVRAA